MPWPTSVLPFPTRLNGEVIDASHVNLVQQEVAALETDLLAAWSTRAFNAAHYSATGGGTWTVEAADVVSFAWKKTGRLVHVAYYITTSSLSGVISNLVITVPVPVARFALGQCFIDENGVLSQGVVDVANPSVTFFRIFKLGLAAFTSPLTNTLSVRGQITYESAN